MEDKKDTAIKHALTVRDAVSAGNYTSFFRLYRMAPNLGTCLMGRCPSIHSWDSRHIKIVLFLTVNALCRSSG